MEVEEVPPLLPLPELLPLPLELLLDEEGDAGFFAMTSLPPQL